MPDLRYQGVERSDRGREGVALPAVPQRGSPGRRRLSGETVTISARPEDQDAILLDRVAQWAAVVPVSFLRINKPDWSLEVIRHDALPLAPEETDAVEDSRLVLELLAIEHRGELLRSRRELLLRAMRRITEGLALTGDERSTLHREGYVWAVELGRWDATGLAALQARFVTQRDGMTELLRTPCDAASEKRWASLARGAGPPQAAIERARQAIRHHANRLGVFAEAEAILHYFLFRLETEDIP